ncbi:MAG: hypothetical protein KBE65_04700 [Phycisphaerae bacterium]|nr:hypothetical protein [Phycisphaerae bacterium]
MRTHWIALVSAVFVCGCACEHTPYQRAVTASEKGYSEKRVSPDTFRIRYVANTCTPDNVLSGYLHRRAAELTLQYGFRYFTVLRDPSQPTHLDTREVATRDAPRKWETVVVEAPSKGTLTMPIQCFKDDKEPPETPLIDAKEYLKGIDNR